MSRQDSEMVVGGGEGFGPTDAECVGADLFRGSKVDQSKFRRDGIPPPTDAPTGCAGRGLVGRLL